MAHVLQFDPVLGPPPGWPFVGGGSQEADAAGSVGDGGGSGDGSGAGREGDGSGDPDAILDLSQVAAEFDREVIESSSGSPSGGKGGDAGEGQSGSSGEGGSPTSKDPFDEYVEKNYQGSRAAAVAGLYESRAEARRMADELAVLKSRIEGTGTPKDTEAEIKKAVETDQEVQSLNQEIAKTDKRTEQIQARNLALTTEANQITEKIATLEQTLASLDDPKEVAKTTNQISKLRTQWTSLNSEFHTNYSRLESFENARTRLTRDLARAEREARESISAKEEQERTREEENNRTRHAFDTSFATLIAPFGLEQESKQYKVLHQSIRAQLADYLDYLGSKGQGLDPAGIREATGKLISAHAEAFNLKPKAGSPKPPASPSRPAAARHIAVPRVPPSSSAGSSTPNSKPGSSSTPTFRTPDDVLSNPDLIRQRANRIFEQASKANAGALRRRGLG